MRRYLFAVWVVVCMVGCKKNPQDMVQPPSSQNPPPPPSGISGLIIYNDELKQGGAFLYPGGDNQMLSFNDQSNPAGGFNIRYAWNGQNTGGGIDFAGTTLIHSGSLNDYNSTPAKDLRAGNYSRVSFNAKGALAANIIAKVEVAAGKPGVLPPCLVLSPDGTEDDSVLIPGEPAPRPPFCTQKASLLNSWQSYSIAVTANDLETVKDYFKVTYINKTQGIESGGGTIYLDNIVYE